MAKTGLVDPYSLLFPILRAYEERFGGNIDLYLALDWLGHWSWVASHEEQHGVYLEKAFIESPNDRRVLWHALVQYGFDVGRPPLRHQADVDSTPEGRHHRELDRQVHIIRKVLERFPEDRSLATKIESILLAGRLLEEGGLGPEIYEEIPGRFEDIDIDMALGNTPEKGTLGGS